MSPAFFYLRDSAPLSQAAYENALRCRAWAAELIANRQPYIRAKGLDPDIHLPHGNWELGGGLYESYRTLRDGGYEVVNNLRMFSDIFTGYQLSSMVQCHGRSLLQSLPPALDDQLAGLSNRPDIHVALYRHIISCLHPDLHITPPSCFGEVGWIVDGKIVNHDTYVYLERLILLAESGKLGELRAAKQPRVLEIGGGFGGFAYHIKKLIPHARYYIVDIPESLIFSSIYLTTLFNTQRNVLLTPDNLGDLKIEEPGLTFVPNYLFDECLAAGMGLDLAINTLSLSEMTEKQVRHYCAGLTKLLGENGAFFEQNHDNRVLGYVDAKAHIRDYFPSCLHLTSPVLHPTQGNAHLWTTTAARTRTSDWAWRNIPPHYRRRPPFNWRHSVGQRLPLWALRFLLWITGRRPTSAPRSS